MKILFISTADYKYGAPKAMMELMGELNRKKNVEIILLTKNHNPLNDWCDYNAIENYSFWYRDIMSGSAYHFWGLNLAKHIVKYLCFLIGIVFQRNILSKLENIFRNVDIIHSNMGRVDIGAWVARKYSKKHVWHLRELESGHTRIVKYKKNCMNYMNHNADAFIAISNIVKINWCKAGIYSDKVEVIYDGIDIDAIEVHKKQSSTLIRIVIVGRLEENKGQLTLIRALRYVPSAIRKNLTVDIIGEGYKGYKSKLLKEIRDNNLDDLVSVKGYKDSINTLLCEYDIGVNCSKGEAFGRITVEYMAAGLIAVVSDTGANIEIVKDMENGIIYKYGDEKAIADKIVFLYQHRDIMEQLANNGKKDAHLYTKQKNADRIYQLYKELMEKDKE